MSTTARTPALAAAAVATAGALALLSVPSTASAHERSVTGHVYESTNDASGNALTVFDRYADGSLRREGAVGTGGEGAGASLHSQGGVARDGRVVFVVNAGDDTVSALAVTKHGLELRDRISTHGDFPVSVTVKDGIGYVLNQGSDTIRGFRYDASGHLGDLHGSTRKLTPNPAGGTTDSAEISFAPNGRALVVTEKASNTIDTFRLSRGYAGNAQPHASAGAVPYGFDFDARGHVIVSEAGTGSASSYRLRHFVTITGALADHQQAACWLVVTGDHAFVVNAASRSISTYRVAADGSLTLQSAQAATTGAGPTDAAVSPDRRSLSLRLGDGSVQSFHIGGGGALTPAGTTAAVAFGTAGLAAD